jgi:hypothetical protein
MPHKVLPLFVAPMQASSAKKPFDSSDWIFETKLDGYRAIAVIDSAGKARIWSRNHLPLEPKFPMVGEGEATGSRSTSRRNLQPGSSPGLGRLKASIGRLPTWVIASRWRYSGFKPNSS